VPFPIGWDPNTSLGMSPGSFASPTMGQASPSASIPMANQQHVSASQLITQYTSATQLMGAADCYNTVPYHPDGGPNIKTASSRWSKLGVS
jgi:hypothetical protein